MMRFKFYGILLVTSLLFVQCELDMCERMDCKNGSECVNGYCDCIDGYTGDDCGIENSFFIADPGTIKLLGGQVRNVEVFVLGEYSSKPAPPVTFSTADVGEGLTVSIPEGQPADSVVLQISAAENIAVGPTSFKLMATSPQGTVDEFTVSVEISSLDFNLLGVPGRINFVEGAGEWDNITPELQWLDGTPESVKLSFRGLTSDMETYIWPDIISPGQETYIEIISNDDKGSYPIELVATTTQSGIEKAFPIDIVVESCNSQLNGDYDVIDFCTSGNAGYDVTISSSASDPDKIWFDNIYDFGADIFGILDCEQQSITIPTQTVNGSTFIGSGDYYMSQGKMNIDLDFERRYTVGSTLYIDDCNAEFTEK